MKSLISKYSTMGAKDLKDKFGEWTSIQQLFGLYFVM